MWEDDMNNEEYERLTYDYDSGIYESHKSKQKTGTRTSGMFRDSFTSSYDDTFDDDNE